MSGKVLIYVRGGGIGSFVASSLAQNGDGLHFTGRDEHKLKAVTEKSKSLTKATSIVDLNLVIPYGFRGERVPGSIYFGYFALRQERQWCRDGC
jgi:hypothetical protein